MVLSRGNRPSRDDLRQTPQSLTELGRSLRVARELAGLSLLQAADRAGTDPDAMESLENGEAAQLPDRIRTLRTLRLYADSLGLPADDLVLAAVELWPDILPPRPIDGGPAHVVSVTTAPAGGHTPAGMYGEEWPGIHTGVTDSTITGVVEAMAFHSGNDTGRVPAYDTGQVERVRQSPPFLLRVMVVLVAVLVVLGGVALMEHSHVVGFYDRAQSTTRHLAHDTAVALDLESNGTTPPHHAATHPLPKVTYTQGPGGNSVVVSVGAPRFSVKLVAFKAPCWVKVTAIFQPKPIFEEVLGAGQSHTFGVNSSITMESASAAARAYVYEGNRFIGFYIPGRAPFTMTFNATP